MRSTFSLVVTYTRALPLCKCKLLLTYTGAKRLCKCYYYLARAKPLLRVLNKDCEAIFIFVHDYLHRGEAPV